MLRGDVGLDRRITTNVSSHLLGRGIRSPCHVRVEAQDGNVTLSGEVQYEHQKILAVDVARHVEGVRRVIDQLRVMPRVDVWKAAADAAARSHTHPQTPHPQTTHPQTSPPNAPPSHSSSPNAPPTDGPGATRPERNPFAL